MIQRIAAGPPSAAGPGTSALPHVLLILDGFPKALGGGERIALRLAALLPRYGFRTSILTFRLHPQSTFRPENAPCPVYLLPLAKTYDLNALRGALSLRRLLKDENVQIVQTFFESSDLWGGLVTRLLSRARLVWSRRDMGILRDRKHVLAYRALRHLPHAVSAVSAKVAESVITVDGVPASRVDVIHNGLDLDLASPLNKRYPAQGPVITTVGNIRRVKGHDLLLRAAPAVLAHFPDAVFTIAGEVLEPDYFAELERLIAELGIAGSVRFVGKVSDTMGHLATADLFVLPSRSEGFSNALIEAMAAGVPSVATDVGGNAEAVRHGATGLIVPAEDVSALSDAMLRVLRDPQLWSAVSIAGRQAVQENFSSDAMLRKVQASYGRLLRK